MLTAIQVAERLHRQRSRFLFRRHSALRRQLVNSLRQFCAQSLQKLVARNSCMLREFVERICTGCSFYVAGRDRLVRTVTNPRMRHAALAALLETPQKLGQAAIDEGACGSACACSAQSCLQPI